MPHRRRLQIFQAAKRAAFTHAQQAAKEQTVIIPKRTALHQSDK